MIASNTHDSEQGFPNAPADINAFLVGADVTVIRRRAKVLLIELSTSYTLMVHLKMTGQMVYVGPDYRFGAGHPNDSLVNTLPDRSTRVTIEFQDGSQLFFNDQRKFGWMKLLPTIEIPNVDFMKKVGPEPLEADFTVEAFIDRFSRRRRTNIKAALLDQTIVAGVGNIYADEALWGAKVHPKRLVQSISPQEFEAIYNELRSVMTLSIEKGGRSNSTYVNA